VRTSRGLDGGLQSCDKAKVRWIACSNAGRLLFGIAGACLSLACAGHTVNAASPAQGRHCFSVEAASNSPSARTIFEAMQCQGGGATWAALLNVLVRRRGSSRASTKATPGWSGNVSILTTGNGSAQFAIDEEGDAAQFCADSEQLVSDIQNEVKRLSSEPAELLRAMDESNFQALECFPPNASISGSRPAGTGAPPRPFIPYQNAVIGLSRNYSNFEDYKSDPNNIAPDERARAANLVRSAPVPQTVADATQAIHAVFGVEFPGYGLTAFGKKELPDGTSLLGFSVEVPTAAQERLIVYRCQPQGCYLVDDAVVADELPIIEVVLSGSELVYRSHDHRELLRRPLRRP
jgi:hypothetical protein